MNLREAAASLGVHRFTLKQAVFMGAVKADHTISSGGQARWHFDPEEIERARGKVGASARGTLPQPSQQPSQPSQP